MEPLIELDSRIRVLIIDYKKVLESKIKFVCSKIKFSYERIKWIIFDPNISDIYGKKPNEIQKVLIGSNGHDYGACNGKDINWISTLAIKRDIQNNFSNEMYKNLNIIIKKKYDFLANVILDELAHIATGCDHGNSQYDEKLKEFHKYYYGSFI